MSAKKTDPLRYPKDVLAAYDYFGRGATSEDLEPSALAIHDWASNPAHRKEFLGLVKDATTQLQRANKDLSDEDAIRAERKTISELKFLVQSAIDESQSKGYNG
jgi:hypothetical protein